MLPLYRCPARLKGQFETYRTPNKKDRQIRAIAHDRTHSVNLAFDTDATDEFELYKMFFLSGESLF